MWFWLSGCLNRKGSVRLCTWFSEETLVWAHRDTCGKLNRTDLNFYQT